MKKFLFFSLAFAVTMTAFTGCSKKDVYDPERPEKDAQELYKENFKAYVGGTINSAVDWGFGATVKSGTRAAEVPTVQLGTDQGDGLEGYSTQFTKAFFQTVQDYFPEDAVCKSNEWLNYEFLENGEFFDVRLIYSNTRANDEIGFYYYDPAVETYENHTKVVLYKDIQNDSGNLSEYIQFNRYAEGGMWFPYRTYGSYAIWTEQKAERIRTRAYTIYMNKTYRFGFYVTNKDTGKTYYTNQFLNADETAYSGAAIGDIPLDDVRQSYVFGLSDNDQPGCNMLFAIIKAGKDGLYPLLIKPEKKKDPEPTPDPPTPDPPTPDPPTPTPEPVWYRIIAEDLNAHDLDKDGEVDDTDFDFNDIVLDVALTDEGASCKLQAAGATLKIRINGDDNFEVHKLFGVEQNQMVNTHASKAGLPGPDGLAPKEFTLTGSFNSVDDIKIEVYRQNRWMTLHAPKGDAASKIVVPITFEWPDERQSLKAKYPNFLKYVQNPDAYKEWWNNVVK